MIIEDALTSYQWRNDPEVWKYTGSKPNVKITKEIESEWIEKALKDETSKRFAILCDEEYIGNVQLTNIADDMAEFHIFIGNKAFWGKRISQLATYQILYYAKEVLKLSEVYLSVKPENISAIKSYENNNFKIIDESQENIKMSLKLSCLENTTVSIFVMVYNHAPFLKECIDGLLMQKADFNYDIIIGEDCSTDDSREILLDYQKKFPGKFRLLLHEKNIGAANNQKITFENCKGKYIAMCEGDDYWTDPLKLQKQVDFLEQNNDHVLCFHKVKILKTDGEIVDDFITKIPENYQLRKTLAENNNYIHTPSVLFRNIIKDELNATEFQKSPIGDYFLYLMITKYGKIGYINEEMAVYRYGVGVFSALDHFQHLKTNLILFTNLYSYETESEIKEIFYTRFLQLVADIQKNQTLAQNKSNILNTRRHILIEKLYKLFKK